MARVPKPMLTTPPKRRSTKNVSGDSALFTPAKRVIKAKAPAKKPVATKSAPKKLARRKTAPVLTFTAPPVSPTVAAPKKRLSASPAKKLSQSMAALPEIPVMISAVAAAKLTPVTSAVSQTMSAMKSALPPTPATSPKVASSKTAASQSRHWSPLKLALAVPVAIIIALAINIMGMYLWNWHGSVSYALTSVVPLPAGKVGGQMISLHEYIQDQRLLATALSNNKDEVVPVTGDGDQIFLRQAAITLMEQELARYGQSVTPEDVDTSYREFISQYRDEATAAAAILKQYGLSTAQFRDHVIRPLVLRSKLQLAITNDASLDFTKKARSKAEEALAAAKQPNSDFKALATQYNQDEASINTGGDIYWFTKGRGQLDPQVEAKLYQLPTGSIYPDIITGPLGFHILYIEAKAANKDEGSESVHLRQILIKVDVDEYLRDLLSHSDVVRYVR